MIIPRAILMLFKDTFLEWYADRGSRLGAALAYYTVFSLAPLLIIAITIVALVFEQEAAQRHIILQMQELVGADGAKTVQTLLDRAYRPHSGIVATSIAIAMLLFGATIVFSELKDALNSIWSVPARLERGFLIGLMRDRFLSFMMVLGIAFLLLLSLVLSGVLAALGGILDNRLSGHFDVLRVGNLLFLFSMVTLLFAMIYKILPDVNIAWSDVLIGAVLTAMLFMIGKFLIGLYLGLSRIAWAYGAAGSLVIVLVWIYYSAQILYFGAEFTKVYAYRHGSKKPKP